MRKLGIIIFLSSLMGMVSCLKEGPNCHFGLTVFNNSEKDIYVNGRYYQKDNPEIGKTPSYSTKEEMLVPAGGSNNQALRDERYCMENNIRDKGGFRLFILDAEIVDVTPWEELRETHAGILFEKIYTLEELQALNFKIIYPDSNY